MIKLSVALVVAVSLGACKKNKAGPAAGDCAAVVDQVVDNWVRKGMTAGVTQAGGAITPEVKAEMDRMKSELGRMSKPVKAALTKACTDDKWSADAVACLRAATTVDAFDACNSKLTAEQQDHAKKVTAEVMTSAAPKGDTACTRYADLEIKCANAGEQARPTILNTGVRSRLSFRPSVDVRFLR